jgi:hypothetical protein
MGAVVWVMLSGWRGWWRDRGKSLKLGTGPAEIFEIAGGSVMIY